MFKMFEVHEVLKQGEQKETSHFAGCLPTRPLPKKWNNRSSSKNSSDVPVDEEAAINEGQKADMDKFKVGSINKILVCHESAWNWRMRTKKMPLHPRFDVKEREEEDLNKNTLRLDIKRVSR